MKAEDYLENLEEVETEDAPFYRKFFVAGVKFHKFNTVKDVLEEGMHVALIFEPTNKFDKNAVMIKTINVKNEEFNNVMLGYVPAAKNGPAKDVSKVLLSGIKLTATITTLSPDFEPWNALEIEVEETNNV